MANNLKALREARGLSQEAAAEKMGTTRNQLAKLESGARRLSNVWIDRAAEVFGVDAGDIVTDKPRRSTSLVDSFDPDEFDPEDHEPRMVEGTMGRDVGDLPRDAILMAEVAVGMGPGGVTHITDLMNADGNTYAAEGVKDWVRLPSTFLVGRFRVQPHRIRCFEAMGDSMEPKIHDGDIVFVDVGHRVPSPPGIYALADALGGVILKRLEISSARGQDPVRVRLISDNPKHSPEDRTLDEIAITGRYLGRLTTE
ncbi:LexA family transcriptional regulator [Methylobacterium sp. 17Sr1-1]|uniref:XRE family transcriptional regulator n=1 Tax=Methylobacterium sp. 17Sr1-1 TaxID=2202826 RepID=UPI0013A5B36E|nr:LexA family transcriptional regulator [Methylobacterium sp. 17Sr1-1]